ncbi:MAG: hypothetical protein ACP6IY_19735 [Promethearchaeia archaeon]
MVQSDIKIEGRKLLEEHHSLFKELIEIPDKREITYREEIRPIGKIGKPRFKNPKYNWEKNLFIKLRNHLQNIWNFFEKYSYWFDDTIIPLLHTDKRRISKKSIIFLLENDIWNTDEVYGDYLIEKKNNIILISYFRRGQRIKQFKLKNQDNTQIKNWICEDAKRQIKEQFRFLWDKLKNEIEACVEEIYHKKPRFIPDPNYLKRQLQKTMKIVDEFPEAALLSLGRIQEFYLLKILNLKCKPYGLDLIKRARDNLNKNDVKLLTEIKKNYDYLKHKTYYKIEPKKIKQLLENFSKLFIINE